MLTISVELTTVGASLGLVFDFANFIAEHLLGSEQKGVYTLDFRGVQTASEQTFFQRCQSIIEESGLELYDLQYEKCSGLLKVIIQNPTTRAATIEDCVGIDRALSPFMEEQKEEGQWSPEKLTLEVSSPGLNRPLKSKKHFKQSVGKQVALKLPGESLKGVLKEVDQNENLHLITVEGENRIVPMKSVKTAHWDFIGI